MIPSYIWLCGDEDGGVLAICDHPTHSEPDGCWLAYHSGHGPAGAQGRPYFSSRELGGFISEIKTHAATHTGWAS